MNLKGINVSLVTSAVNELMSLCWGRVEPKIFFLA